ncbi:hypothetical protein L7F22_002156 [Adiantum nelumboides]|nr:hypothetical protein [Adiantum nelumboides]
MALQWVMLGAAATAEALLALLLTVPYPPPLRRRLVALIASLLQPALGIIPFAAFQLLDIYWKNEHRLNCSSDVCTLPERDRYERSLFKAQRNTLLAIGSCFLYWNLEQSSAFCKVTWDRNGNMYVGLGTMTSWFQLHGFSMNRLPPFQFSLDASSLSLTQSEITRLIRQDLIQLHTKRTWI